jgi:hypothetical protein
MKEYYLEVCWTVSKGRDSYGYNICTLWDKDKPYRTNGGGYDMLGTVFGGWLKENYLEKLKTLVPYDEEFSMKHYQEHGFQPRQENYGLFHRKDYWAVDGACGLDCMISLARKIGLKVKTNYSVKKNCTDSFSIVEETENEKI